MSGGVPEHPHIPILYRKLHTVLYTVHSTLYTLHSSLYTLHSTPYTEDSTGHYVHCTVLNTVIYTVNYSVKCTVYCTLHFTSNKRQCDRRSWPDSQGTLYFLDLVHSQ